MNAELPPTVPYPGWGAQLLELISRFTNQTCHLLNPVDESDLHWEMARSILENKPAAISEDFPGLSDLPLDDAESGPLQKAG